MQIYPHITVRPEGGGKLCPQTVFVDCDLAPCPPAVDCQFSMRPTPCSMTCGPGSSQLIPRVSQAARNGGAGCPTDIVTVSCNQGPCPQGELEHIFVYTNCLLLAIDCRFSTVTTPCSASCGGEGTRQRIAKIISPAENGGQPCPTTVKELDCDPLPDCPPPPPPPPGQNIN